MLENKVALITGGAKGMGKAMALKFAREGCDIIICDTDIDNAVKVAGEVQAVGRISLAVQADISSSQDVENMVSGAIEKFGKIDILVNNAGRAGGGSLENSTEEDWDKVLAINLKGHFLVTKTVVPYMKKQKSGKIVFISSMGAVHPSISVLSYHSAKAGLIGLTYNLAFELASNNICVNCIVPGPVETPFWDALTRGMSEDEKTEYYTALASKEVPLGRMGTAEDIAGPALFLVSDLSDYVTGQVLYVAGGQPGMPVNASFLLSDTK
ncbi:MAG: SDR family oxidoreductase [Dehalococcoidales bacterium]|nr:SDR family oxidoreductase [Dehalococcoidales bacterium]